MGAVSIGAIQPQTVGMNVEKFVRGELAGKTEVLA
jgi:hypothetical protein